MKCTIAVAQIDCVLSDLAANVRKHVEVIRKARDGGADLVVFPELSLSGYSIRDSNWDLAIRVDSAARIKAIVDESAEISVLFGGIEESDEYGIYNAAFLAEKGSLRSVHRKTYPPTYGMFEELRYFSPGKTVRAFESSIGRLGVLVCEDLWHLSLPYILAEDGAEVIIAIAAGPSRMSGPEGIAPIARLNSEHHRTYARLLSTYLIYCNRVGIEDGVSFWGGSEIVAPGGELLAQAKLFEEDLIFAELDSNEVRRARRFSRHILDDEIALVGREIRRIEHEREKIAGARKDNGASSS